ncbi:hypothetical protein GGF50DRAFT_117964 [Schizophyllum commune]
MPRSRSKAPSGILTRTLAIAPPKPTTPSPPAPAIPPTPAPTTPASPPPALAAAAHDSNHRSMFKSPTKRPSPPSSQTISPAVTAWCRGREQGPTADD